MHHYLIAQEPEQSWPVRKITATKGLPNLFQDGRAFMQKISLDCGHWFFNTWGGLDKSHALNDTDTIGCRACYLSKQ
jgi:hypothetical protein